VYRRVPTTHPDSVFLNRGWFCDLIIVGLAMMTLLGAARSSASRSDSSMRGVSSPPGLWSLLPRRPSQMRLTSTEAILVSSMTGWLRIQRLQTV
jgi:hypothetical protein